MKSVVVCEYIMDSITVLVAFLRDMPTVLRVISSWLKLNTCLPLSTHNNPLLREWKHTAAQLSGDPGACMRT
ncbi:hypothetical protein D1872_346320 [compost metagenome]